MRYAGVVPVLEVGRGYGVETRTEVVPTGIRSSDFRSRDGPGFRRRRGIAAQRPVIAYIGRVAHEKKVEFLVRVLDVVRREQPDILLIIVGEGPAEMSIRKLVSGLGLDDHVHYVGYLDRATELADCYCAADALVLASRARPRARAAPGSAAGASASGRETPGSGV